MFKIIQINILAFIILIALTSCKNVINPVPKIKVYDSKYQELINNTSSYDCGEVIVQNLKVCKIYIKNNGDSSLIISSNIEITGSGASAFEIFEMPTEKIRAGKTEMFSIGFTPTDAINYSATVSIISNDINQSNFTFTINGLGIEPEIAVYDSYHNQIVINVDTYDFGGCRLFESLKEKFTIKNIGSSEISLNGSPCVEIVDSDIGAFTITTMPKLTLSPGETSYFEIMFTAIDEKEFTAKVIIPNSQTDDYPFVFFLNAKCYEPSIKIVDTFSHEIKSGISEFTYADTEVTKSNISEFKIYNIGLSPLVLSGAPRIEINGSGSKAFKVVKIPGGSIDPESYGIFSIEFIPCEASTLTAFVSIISNDQDKNPFVFTISGKGIKPEMIIRDSLSNVIPSGTGVFDFGIVKVDEPLSVEFTIRNEGDSILNLKNPPYVQISGTHQYEFSILSQPTSPLQPGHSTKFTIEFEPSSRTDMLATVTIENTDVYRDPYTFTVKGKGGQPEIVIMNGNNEIPSLYGTYDFGIHYLGYTAVAETFTIHNIGDCKLYIYQNPDYIQKYMGDVNQFDIEQYMTSSPISPGNYTTFKVTFDPTSVGDKSLQIRIINSDEDEQYATIELIGKARNPGPEIQVLEGSNDIENLNGVYDYSTIGIGSSSSPILFTIKNTGIQNLTLSGAPRVAVSGSNATEFIVNTTGTSSTVTPGDQTYFYVTFKPTSQGDKTATITILNNDSDENPFTFKLKGYSTSLSPEILVKQNSTIIPCTTGSYNMGYISVGATSTNKVFTIENIGLADLHLTGTPKISVSGSDASMFSINETSTLSTISMGSSTTFTIMFKPSSPGTKSAYISISNDDSDENPYTFKVIGEASGNDYQWTKEYKCSNYIIGKSIKIDSAGNIYIAGSFKNTVNFAGDFGGTDSKSSSGENDAFLTRINANGTYGWTRRIGGSNDDEIVGLTFDQMDNIYVVGNFEGVVNFGIDFSTSDGKTSSGSSDIFVTKISSNGSYVWTRKIGGTSDDLAYGIASDSSGNVYLTGSIKYQINFAADFGGNDLRTYIGGSDAFVTKVNSNGAYGWSRSIGGSNDQVGTDITVDASGNIYVTGTFYRTADFSADFSGSDIKNSNNNSNDIFVTKITSTIGYGWTRVFGSIDYDTVYGIVSTNDAVYITGYFTKTVNFGADFSINDIKTALGDKDVFVTKIFFNGTYGWTRRIGGVNYTLVYDIAADSNGDVYVTGWFPASVNFAEDFGGFYVKIAKSIDVYVTKIGSTGDFKWTKRFGSSSCSIEVYAIALDSSGYIYIAGRYKGNPLDFGEDFGVSDPKTEKWYYAAFVTKFKS